MLKSLSTQFAATLFFGPLGLAYSSVAGAVFLTLLFAVLYFTELGMLAAVIVWPLAIVAGMVFVKLHNDQMRASGSRLLLGPDEDASPLGTLGSWGRGIAVLSLLAVVGYLAFWYSPGNNSKPGRIVDAAPAESTLTGNTDTENNSMGNDSSDAVVIASTNTGPEIVGSVDVSDDGNGSFSVVTLDQQESEPVVIGTSSVEQEISSDAVLYVDAPVVNLRDGPGTDYKILVQVERGDQLNEIERDGDWVNVTAARSGTTGWIFGRLVSSQQ